MIKASLFNDAGRWDKDKRKEEKERLIIQHKKGEMNVINMVKMSLHLYVTLHHKMSRNVPDGHFMFLYFLKVNSVLFTTVKFIFKSQD